MQKLVNLTSHQNINLFDDNGNLLVQVPRAPGVLEALPRITTSYEVETTTMMVDGEEKTVEIASQDWGDPINFPEPGKNTLYIVSRLFILGCRAKGYPVHHLCSPGPLLRDSDGEIIGSRGISPAE